MASIQKTDLINQETLKMWLMQVYFEFKRFSKKNLIHPEGYLQSPFGILSAPVCRYQ